MLRLESKLDDGKGNGMWPRADKGGNKLHDWSRYLQEAANETARRLRSMKSTAEPFELGRLEAKSKDRLRPVVTCFALHFLFVDADNSGDQGGFFSRKASYYWERAADILEAESPQLDYDIDNSGTIDDIEKNQPFVARVTRG